MPTNKTPLAKARLTGADKKDPQRYRDRNEPDGGPPIGDPPHGLPDAAQTAWSRFTAELPWLVEADRAILSAACLLRAAIDADPEGATASHFREYRQTLSSLGATPTSRSHIAGPTDDEDNPFDQFLV
jgi:phage terminase small subunit